MVELAEFVARYWYKASVGHISLLIIVVLFVLFYLGEKYNDRRVKQWASSKGLKLISFEKCLFSGPDGSFAQDLANMQIMNQIRVGRDGGIGYHHLMEKRYRIYVLDSAGNQKKGWLKLEWPTKQSFVLWDQ